MEKLAEEGQGSWLLVKINVDDRQDIGMRYSVQGIPAVKAFKNGHVCDEFVGAMPEGQIAMWLDGFVDGPADDLIKQAEAHLKSGDTQAARASLDEVFSHKPRHQRGTFVLAKLEFAEEKLEEAERHLNSLAHIEDEALQQEIAAFKLVMHAGGGDVASLRKQTQDNPDDLQAYLSLGQALAGTQPEEALRALLTVIEKSPSASEPLAEAARKSMVEIFQVLGMQHEITATYRSLLAQQLYK